MGLLFLFFLSLDPAFFLFSFSDDLALLELKLSILFQIALSFKKSFSLELLLPQIFGLDFCLISLDFPDFALLLTQV